MKRVIVGIILALGLSIGTTVVAISPASASHVPASIACQYFEPHEADYPEPGQQYWTNDGDGAYRCIYRHPQGGTDPTHYYIVCHELYYWWWEPGLAAWVALDCD